MQENPFSDLIPKKNMTAANNPFADLIPQHNEKSQSSLDKLANSIPINALLGAGDAISNLMRGSADLIPGVNIPLAKTGEGTAYNVGKMAGDVAGFLGGGEALDTARAATEGTPLVGKLAQALGKDGLSGVGRRALGSGLYGAIENPNDKGKGAGETAALSIALDSLLGGASKLLPSNLLKGNLSNEELAKNLEVSRGTNTPIGDVVGSPKAKQWYENLVNRIPGSGSDLTSAETANEIKDAGNSLVNKYLGHTNPAEVPDKLLKSLQEAFYSHNAEKNSFYSDAYDHANKIGFKLELPTFKDTVNKYKNIIDNQDFLKFEPQEKKLLSALSNYGQAAKDQYKPQTLIDNVEGKLPERIYPDLRETNIFSGNLKGFAKNANASPLPADRNMANVYRELGTSLKSDIKNSIEKSGNKDLMDLWTEAEQNYAKNYSPFLDKDIYKFIGGNKNASADDLISAFIKTGKNTDKSQQLNKLMSKLDPEGQDLLKYAYLSRAITGAEDARSVDPNKLKNLWNEQNLGQSQKKVLFPDKNERKQFDDFARLVGMNSNALSRMGNPNTGQTAIPWIIGGLLASGGAATGGAGGAALGSMITPLATTLLAKAANKYATSPTVREKLVNSMIQNKAGNNKYKEALKAALASTFINQ